MSFIPSIGVLAFQGDFSEHMDVLRSLGIRTIEVRSLVDLAQVDGLIIPGGESTVIAKFLRETGVGEEIVRRALRTGKAGRAKKDRLLSVFGTCAGAILLARKATGKNAPRTLGLIDITVDRNAYGTQVNSFEAAIQVKGLKTALPVAFIRAPKIIRVGKGVEVLARHRGFPVLVRQGNILASTFHAEVRCESQIHRLFLCML